MGSTKPTASAVRVLAAAAMLLSFSPLAHAQTGTGPFAGLAGSWAGSGTIQLSNGAAERLRCDATYSVLQGSRNLRQDLRCASDSSNFNLRTDVEAQGGAITGRWLDVGRNVQGGISGRASGGRIEAVAQGPGFSASLAISIRGNRQSVSIRSQGTELSQVSIELSRTR
jgi:hypothetical protein